jgi:dipeptide/tripeptide permease
VSKLNAYCILICSNKWYERFLIHGRLYFELSYGTMQLTLDCPFWYFLSARSELIYNLFPEAQPIKRVKKVAQMISFRTVTVYSKTWSSQCKLNAQCRLKKIRCPFFQDTTNNSFIRNSDRHSNDKISNLRMVLVLFSYMIFWILMTLNNIVSFLYVEPQTARSAIFWLQMLISPAT